MKPESSEYVPPPRTFEERLTLAGRLFMRCTIVAFPTALVASLIALVTNASEVIQAVLVFVSLAVALMLTVVKVVRDDTHDHAIKHRPVAPREPSYGGWSPPFGTAAYYLKEINDRQNRGDL